MAKRGQTSIRKGQLIAPFGVGAMTVSKDGISMICSGLDHWFNPRLSRVTDPDKFRIQEWRLERYLGVDHFREPPDYREFVPGDQNINVDIRIPARRFPQWHSCPRCKRLEKLSASQIGRSFCPECESTKNRKFEMVQVGFIAMCEHGHIQDFPWREWAHEDENTTCKKPMYLKRTGGLSLGSLRVECQCGAKRSLAGITMATTLSKGLNSTKSPFWCQGHRPWLGDDAREVCAGTIRGALRGATNVYYADVRSAIYLPRGGPSAPDALVALLEQSPLSTVIDTLKPDPQSLTAQRLRISRGGLALAIYTDEQIQAAIKVILKPNNIQEFEEDLTGAKIEEQLRLEEQAVLLTNQSGDELTIRKQNLLEYDKDIFPIADYFSHISLIERLRETRALVGFSRVLSPSGNDDLESRQKMLWRNQPDESENWLPAIQVYGEGIYLEINAEKLARWESIKSVQNSAKRLEKRQPVGRERGVSPRLLLIHTLAHLLINQLTFECGYSSASLRERLYVATPASERAMAGFLIYTSAGDSEGTMGGLVRMGKPGYLEKVLRRAIEGSRWCSADPICMELGGGKGQGPNSCNGAACHNCALIPETSCELFNSFLDRGMVIGDMEGKLEGFFTSH
jgi:hypothetical protein